MKKSFPGHFKLTKSQQDQLWKTGVIVFDANVLLHLYRYSDQTRIDLLATIDKLSERVWIPHRVGMEYFRRRLDVIVQQEKAYQEAINDLTRIEDTLKNQRHPFVSVKMFEAISKVLAQAKEELNQGRDTHAKRLTHDDLMEKLAKLFDDKVGAPYSDEEIKRLCAEGEKRYALKIPPGYKDQDKDKDGDPTRPFGDLFVWDQVIQMASKKQVGVIFVTDDSKEDWWLTVNGKTIGPRPELVHEFQDRCKSNIMIAHTQSGKKGCLKSFAKSCPRMNMIKRVFALHRPTQPSANGKKTLVVFERSC